MQRTELAGIIEHLPPNCLRPRVRAAARSFHYGVYALPVTQFLRTRLRDIIRIAYVYRIFGNPLTISSGSNANR